MELGAEVITQYTMYSSGYTELERYKIADDMGFGFLLMLGLIPEVIIGSIVGWFVGKKINVQLFGI